MNEWSQILFEQVTGAWPTQHAISVQCDAEVWTYLHSENEEYFSQTKIPHYSSFILSSNFNKHFPR